MEGWRDRLTENQGQREDVRRRRREMWMMGKGGKRGRRERGEDEEAETVKRREGEGE